ncbi:hypothetical protein GCM10007079_33120 [Nocardiopsis terrae]|nr:hypothetical protein GCM10007079_33120 [Nocardiopsis terrae]
MGHRFDRENQGFEFGIGGAVDAGGYVVAGGGSLGHGCLFRWLLWRSDSFVGVLWGSVRVWVFCRFCVALSGSTVVGFDEVAQPRVTTEAPGADVPVMDGYGPVDVHRPLAAPARHLVEAEL